MNAESAYNFIYSIAPYAPLVILIASTLDIFFVTGYILYGAAMMSSVLMLHASGMISTEMLVVAALTGTLLGNTGNYWAGYWFGETQFIQKKLKNPKVQHAKEKFMNRGLCIFVFIGRFITFTRPAYALLLGSMKVSFSKFITTEVPIAFIWVVFWLCIILQGESLYFHLTS